MIGVGVWPYCWKLGLWAIVIFKFVINLFSILWLAMLTGIMFANCMKLSLSFCEGQVISSNYYGLFNE
jgi:hypothetical protein